MADQNEKNQNEKNQNFNEDEKRMYQNLINSGSKHPLVDDSKINMGIKRKDYTQKEKEEEVQIEKETEIILRFVKCECCEEWRMPDEIFSVETCESLLIEEDVNNDEVVLKKELKEETQIWCLDCIKKIRDHLDEKEITKFEKDLNLAKQQSQKIVRLPSEEDEHNSTV
jgi:hypothetical protein